MVSSLLLYTPTGIANQIIEVIDNTTTGVTRTLSNRGVGQIVTVKDGIGMAGTNNITVVDDTGALFDGKTSYVINSNWGSVDLYWNGNAWRIKTTSSGGSVSIPFITTGVSFTRPNDTTAYAFGDTVANSTVAGSVIPLTIAASNGTNIPSTILRARLNKSGTSNTNAMFRLHFYSVLPTSNAGDNAAFSTNQSATYIGDIDVNTSIVFSDGCTGEGVPNAGATMSFTPSTGTSNIFCILEARNTYTPAAQEVFTVILEVQ